MRQLCGCQLGFHGNREEIIKNKIRLFKLITPLHRCSLQCRTVKGGTSLALGTSISSGLCSPSKLKRGREIGSLGLQVGLPVERGRLHEHGEYPISIKHDVTYGTLTSAQCTHCSASKFTFLGNNTGKPWGFIIKGLRTPDMKWLRRRDSIQDGKKKKHWTEHN